MPKPYDAPTMTPMDPHEVIRKLMHELTGPLGETPEERVAKAASAIRNVLERLPPEERDDALAEVVGGSGRWVKKAAWAP